jgi:hypothetical protein
MARVADVRRLGSAGVAVGAGIPEGERQFYTKPPPGMSRSKAGRSLSSSMGNKTGAGAGGGRGARGTPAHAQLSFAASSMRSASPSGGGRPSSSAAGGGRRPSSRGDISSNSGGGQSRSGAGWSSGSIRFAAPEGSYGKQVVMEAQAAVAEEEDLFEVLQRRIEAQRSELREGRESIENVMKSEVGPVPILPQALHPTPCTPECKRGEERGGPPFSLKPYTLHPYTPECKRGEERGGAPHSLKPCDS